MIRLSLVAVLFMVAGISGALPTSCATQISPGDAITGDYLFDRRDISAVFLTHVYEDGNDLYAMLDIADKPMKLEVQDAGKREYRMRYGSNTDFTLRFIEGEGGEIEQLNMKSNTYELDITGDRFTDGTQRLRDYHADRPRPYVYMKPLQIDGDWEVATLNEAGLDTTSLCRMMNDIYENYNFIHSVLIVKDGKLVFEEYLNGWDPLRLHRLQSVTKSFTSTLVGLAIREGYIGSIGDPVYEYLPEYASLFDEAKKKIRMEHLLTMTAGFEWNELETYYDDPKACDAHAAGASGDFIKFVLERPLVTEPGTAWYYNSGYPNMLGYIIEQKSGMNLLGFSFKYLFEPIGIKRAYWQPTTGETRPSCAGGLRLASRDMARYGLLHLRNGVWDGVQVVPADYVEASTKQQLDTRREGGYGYLWRTYEQEGFSAFMASGTGGQYIVCVPAADAVVVTTAIYSTNKSDDVAGLLIKYVVPALMK
jgi:CubicO group peptidase (beta-lactamase class C family)